MNAQTDEIEDIQEWLVQLPCLDCIPIWRDSEDTQNCQHGVACDVHCCTCHTGFEFSTMEHTETCGSRSECNATGRRFPGLSRECEVCGGKGERQIAGRAYACLCGDGRVGAVTFSALIVASQEAGFYEALADAVVNLMLAKPCTIEEIEETATRALAAVVAAGLGKAHAQRSSLALSQAASIRTILAVDDDCSLRPLHR